MRTLLVQRCKRFVEWPKVYLRGSMLRVDGSKSRVIRSNDGVREPIHFVRRCSDVSSSPASGSAHTA
ncbi:MAG: hypothetical protein ABIW82_03540 [Dokdonella sp.]